MPGAVTSKPRILIVGCGIGGMAAALCLRRAGMTATVLEQAAALTSVGAGIQLSPNAVRILNWLGLEDDLAAFGVLPESLIVRSYDGAPILETPLGAAARARFGAAYYHAHRADLLSALVAKLGLQGVRLGTRAVDLLQAGDRVGVALADGSAMEADVVIGADGIHSMVRGALFDTAQPRFSGTTAWRGVIPAASVAAFDIPKTTSVWWGPDRSMVHYYVSGGRAINWIGIVPADGDSVESWSATGAREDALREFAGWHPQVLALIEATEQPFKWALHDREPLPSWVDGRIALLGDAAHSMLPYHAQGAAQSIEDAWVLARCLAEGGDEPEQALARYQSLRIERANWVQRFSREAEQLFHMADPEDRRRRDEKLRINQSAYPHGFPPGQERLYGYDAERAVAEGVAGR
ncbi:MAG: FAD-dependent monooxygenase [Minwuiales bacterium]|nr:FAD-dependent monooxygenase [Minwuiales bacterium]